MGWKITKYIFVAALFFSAAIIAVGRAGAEDKTAAGTELGADSSAWGKVFPRQYQGYLKTQNMDFTSYENGNTRIDMLERDPRLVILWAGTGFSRDYQQSRGHYYSIEDARGSARSKIGQPMACWSCKSPDALLKIKASGPEKFYQGKFADGIAQITHPIGCLDCHDPATLSIRSARPALEEALSRQGKSLDKAGTPEKRALVCAQCHAEYYLKGEGNYLTFPWDNGVTAEAIEKYYDDAGFQDWTHKLSRAPMLKAQHPDYELYTRGVLAQLGLTCADCHMPGLPDGKEKFSDHHVRSPLNNIANACLRCHPEGEEAVRDRVYELQRGVAQLRIKTEDILVAAHIEAKQAWDAGATQEEMQDILRLIRKAQWYWDFASSSHGAAFHATGEVTRILNLAVAAGTQAKTAVETVLIKHGVKVPVAMPDISTKAKARAYIDLTGK